METINMIRNEKSEMRWVEGLILLILILVTILVGSYTSKAGITTILDEQVGASAWTDSIDNLE